MFTRGSTGRLGMAAGVLAVALWVAPAYAAPNPPLPYWGSSAGGTFNEGFEFGNAADPYAPDAGGARPFGSDPAEMDPPDPNQFDVSHEQQFQGQNGVLLIKNSSGQQLNGELKIKVYNVGAGSYDKTIWLQIRYFISQGSGPDPTVEGVGKPNKPPRTSAPTPLGTSTQGNWTTKTYRWTMSSQPEWEYIKLKFRLNAGGQIAFDQIYVSTHCNYEDQMGHAYGYDFAIDIWEPEPIVEGSSPEHGEPIWETYGSEAPGWMAEVTDHEGVIGLPGGVVTDGELVLVCDDIAEPGGVKYVSCRFDYFCEEEPDASIVWSVATPLGTVIENYEQTIDELDSGWRRCRITFDASPPPDWEEFSWVMTTGEGSDAVAIDNLIVSSSVPRPAEWYDGFDFYDNGSGLHGQYGWKGWDNDPTQDAYVTDEQSYSWLQSVDVAGDANVVHEFEGYTSDEWVLSAWIYVPSDFESGGTGQFAGSHVVILNTYADGGPHEDPWRSVEMDFDSNDGMLKVYHGDGLNTVDVPYVEDEWVEVNVKIDLDIDWCMIYYNEAPVTEYSWTGGAYGGGGGASEIAAVNLYANGSTSIYYEDLSLGALRLLGDLNCDGSTNGLDIDPFVLALTDPLGYSGEHPACDYWLADCNEDGSVNGLDIDPFVAVLTEG